MPLNEVSPELKRLSEAVSKWRKNMECQIGYKRKDYNAVRWLLHVGRELCSEYDQHCVLYKFIKDDVAYNIKLFPPFELTYMYILQELMEKATKKEDYEYFDTLLSMKSWIDFIWFDGEDFHKISHRPEDWLKVMKHYFSIGLHANTSFFRGQLALAMQAKEEKLSTFFQAYGVVIHGDYRDHLPKGWDPFEADDDDDDFWQIGMIYDCDSNYDYDDDDDDDDA